MRKFTTLGVACLLWASGMMAQNAWINEIHYDNAGTDAGEFIEVVLQNAGNYTLSDFQVILYNGSGGASYDTKSLNLFTAGAVINSYSFYYYTYPVNGIQNGSPDGMALSYQGALIPGQFLSYEGTFTASNGPAAGITSTDIGVSETSTTPLGQSLQLGGAGSVYSAFAWQSPLSETPGIINANQTLTGAVDPEPTNYPTLFTAIPDIFQIDLSWVDATGGQEPAAYLLLGSNADNIVAPVDGVPVADDPDLSDGTAALNVIQGTQAASFPDLPGNQIYYFKLFPYTNGGPAINYKTDGTPPSASGTTPDVVIINEEDFNTSTLGTWTQISVIGSQIWGIEPNFGVGGTPCAKMSGYQGGSNQNEDWLISPAMNFNHFTDEHFRFQSAKNYAGPDLQIFISSNYAGSGDPNLATWSPLTPVLSSGSWNWTPSGSLDVSGTAGSSVFLSFKYTSTSTESATWEVDEILVTGVPDFSGPTVITSPDFTNITNNTATGGGDVTDDGGSSILSRGLCYATTMNPTLGGMHTIEAGATGPFTSDMTGLSPETQYYVRAYAINALDTSYGNNATFTTLCDPNPPIPDFWASTTTIMIGETIDFFDNTAYCPDQWQWSFVGGNPMSSTEQNPTDIMWEYPGVYNVCLTTTNAYGTNTLCKMGYITVNAPSQANIVITEIMYNPPESGTDTLEFIELYNNDVTAVNLENFYFSKGVVFSFPAVTLNPGSYLLVSESAQAMMNTFGVTAYQWTDGALNNGGEEIVLNEPLGYAIDSVNYSDMLPWDTLPDGWGPSLELCDPGSNNSLPENWRHALEFAAVNGAGDTIWASPLQGCSYPPVAGFVADDTTIVVGGLVNFTDGATGTVELYEWTFEGGEPASFTGAVPPAILYPEMGSYDVTLKVSNIAGQSILVKPDYIEVGPSALTSQTGQVPFSVYPNPVIHERITIAFPVRSVYAVTLMNELGNAITQTETSAEKTTLELSNLKSGLYLLQVQDLITGATGFIKVIIL